jgi:CSLREA domain-containing protein
MSTATVRRIAGARAMLRIALIVTVVIASQSAVEAATITVTTTADTAAADGFCSLREAIQAANTNAAVNDCGAGASGSDTIAFNISGLGPFIIGVSSALPTITEPIVIDGRTQSGASCAPRNLLIAIAESGAPAGTNGLTLGAGSSGSQVWGVAVQGFDGDGVNFSGIGIRIESSSNLVACSHLGTNLAGNAQASNANGIGIVGGSSNAIGNSTTAGRNVISANGPGGVGVTILGNGISGNVVSGNLIGVGLDGATVIPLAGGGSQLYGVAVYGLDGTVVSTTIGGTNGSPGGACSGACNVISGNDAGIWLQYGTISGTTIKGNHVGTDVSGTLDRGNVGSYGGVVIAGGDSISGTTIGGSASGEGNLVSGNTADGIHIEGGSSLASVTGNRIGTASDGLAALGNGGHGIFILASPNIMIGGPGGAGNLIANNGGDGIAIVGLPPACISKWISHNSIDKNGGLGIDLNNDGPTPNDAGDPDTGPNNLQNFPVLSSATGNASQTTVDGSLNSTAGSFTIELFSSPACDPSGFGEGATFLGSSTVQIIGTDVTFQATIPVAVPAGHVVTATATDGNGDTSEFSSCVAINRLDAQAVPAAGPAGLAALGGLLGLVGIALLLRRNPQ